MIILNKLKYLLAKEISSYGQFGRKHKTICSSN